MFGKVHNFVADHWKADPAVMKQVKEATNNDVWNVSNKELQNIAFATFEADQGSMILEFLWQILSTEGKHIRWRKVLKTLTLLDALLKHGSNQTIQNIRKETWRIARWRNHYVHEGGREIGGGIRERANTIVELCNDPQELQREREKAQDLLQRVQGIGNAPQASKFRPILKPLFVRNRKKRQEDETPETGSHVRSSSDFSHDRHGWFSDELERRATISRFCDITNASPDVASDWLEQCNYALNQAISQYLESTDNYGSSAMRAHETKMKNLFSYAAKPHMENGVSVNESDKNCDSNSDSESSTDHHRRSTKRGSNSRSGSRRRRGGGVNPSNSWPEIPGQSQQESRSFNNDASFNQATDGRGSNFQGSSAWPSTFGTAGSSWPPGSGQSQGTDWPPWSCRPQAATGFSGAYGSDANRGVRPNSGFEPPLGQNPFFGHEARTTFSSDLSGSQGVPRHGSQPNPWRSASGSPKPSESSPSAFPSMTSGPNQVPGGSPPFGVAPLSQSPNSSPSNPFSVGGRSPTCMNSVPSNLSASKPFGPNSGQRSHNAGAGNNTVAGWGTPSQSWPGGQGPLQGPGTMPGRFSSPVDNFPPTGTIFGTASQH